MAIFHSKLLVYQRVFLKIRGVFLCFPPSKAQNPSEQQQPEYHCGSTHVAATQTKHARVYRAHESWEADESVTKTEVPKKFPTLMLRCCDVFMAEALKLEVKMHPDNVQKVPL